MPYTLKQFEIGPMQNFSYVIGDEKTKDAFVVDPAWQADTIVKTVEEAGFKLKGLLVSHAHYDHTNAILDLLKKFDIPVYANANEVGYSQLGTSIVGKLGNTVKPMQADDSVMLGETKVNFLHTPGHTPGSQCILVGNHLITGDTLFIGGCGRSDLPGGDAPTPFKSLKKISGLSPQLEICPGHDYGFVPRRFLGDEIKDNPYLKMSSEEEFITTIS